MANPMCVDTPLRYLVRVWSIDVMIKVALGLVSYRFRAIGQALLADSSLFPRDVVPMSCLLLMAINGVSGLSFFTFSHELIC